MKTSLKIASIVLALASLTACMPNYSNGSRAGVVTKLSEKGFVFKSHEGSMNLSGTRTSENGSVVANTFNFNVSPAMVSAVQDAMRSGKRVELVYTQWALNPPTIDSDYVIVGVKSAE